MRDIGEAITLIVIDHAEKSVQSQNPESTSRVLYEVYQEQGRVFVGPPEFVVIERDTFKQMVDQLNESRELVHEMVYDDIEQKYSDWSVGPYWDRANNRLHKHKQNPETGLCSGKCTHCGTGHQTVAAAMAARS